MTVALRRTMTLDEFLIWEAGQEFKHEFDGFQPVAMNGGTMAHSLICTNLVGELFNRLAGEPCRVQSHGLKLVVAGSVRYPDAFVTCSALVNDATIDPDPVVVFEVLSKSTATTDLKLKSTEYRATPSIQRYAILMQDSIAAIVHERAGDRWSSAIVTDDDAVLAMPEIGIELPLAAPYARLSFETSP